MNKLDELSKNILNLEIHPNPSNHQPIPLPFKPLHERLCYSYCDWQCGLWRGFAAGLPERYPFPPPPEEDVNAHINQQRHNEGKVEGHNR